MKKLFPIALGAVAAMTFTSCKKVYTCSCTSTDRDPYSVILTESKKNAEQDCQAMSATYVSNGVTVVETCTLK